MFREGRTNQKQPQPRIETSGSQTAYQTNDNHVSLVLYSHQLLTRLEFVFRDHVEAEGRNSWEQPFSLI